MVSRHCRHVFDVPNASAARCLRSELPACLELRSWRSSFQYSIAATIPAEGARTRDVLKVLVNQGTDLGRNRSPGDTEGV
jgi:hypothetical protein